MQFLKTLLWVVAAVLLVLFGSANWEAVTVRLWGGLQVDIKLPVLVLLAFLLGFLPTLIVHRAKLWSLKRRLEALERPVANTPFPVAPPAPRAETAPIAEPAAGDRVATDQKLWP
jgi:uncharacterized integral membrane protein